MPGRSYVTSTVSRELTSREAGLVFNHIFLVSAPDILDISKKSIDDHLARNYPGDSPELSAAVRLVLYISSKLEKPHEDHDKLAESLLSLCSMETASLAGSALGSVVVNSSKCDEEYILTSQREMRRICGDKSVSF